jgi:DNA polymerase-3 subunit delta'
VARKLATPTAPLAPPPPSANGWPVWGHDIAVADLRRAVASDRVAHAYLIAGPDGVGKTALAHAFARALCCQQADRPDPSLACGECLACRKVGRGTHPDVETFSLATQAAVAEKSGGKNTTLTIDTARQVRAATALRPLEARWRVLLVEDAETLQGPAQEALLKTLEEPPSFVVLILLADDAELLLPTIRSRCRLVELRPVARGVVERSLLAAGADPDLAAEVAGLAAGRPGWARRAAADPRLLDERRAALERALGWIAGTPYDRLVAAFRLGDGFTKRRAEVFADLDAVLGVWRDALLLHAAQPHYLTYRGIAERLTELARGWDLAALHRAVRAVQACIADLEANVRPRLAMEAMVLAWPIPPERR